MTIDAASSALSADPRSLEGLKRNAGAGDRSPETLKAVAQQFESVFAQMLIKSMRATSLGDGLMDSQQSDFYRDMFDQQISVELAKGRGLGLADMLVHQLSGLPGQSATTGSTDSTAEPAAGAATKTTQAAQAVTTVSGTATEAKESHWPPKSREEFVRQIWPHAEAAARRLGVDAATIVSHAALETGWGKHLPKGANGAASFNLFGIKATHGWRGSSVQSSTVEHIKGAVARIVAPFRAYASLGESISDYAHMLGNNPRYAAALNTGSDVGAFAKALQHGGYATDPAYAAKLRSVASRVSAIVGATESLKVADARPITSATRSAT